MTEHRDREITYTLNFEPTGKYLEINGEHYIAERLLIEKTEEIAELKRIMDADCVFADEQDEEIAALKQEVAGGSWAFVKQIEELQEQNKRFRQALEHPDIKELDCDCGYFESASLNGGGVRHTCIKCFAEKALKNTNE